MADSDIIELFVVPSRGILDALVRGKTDPNPVSSFALTQSDNAVLRVRFFSEVPATAELVPIDYGVTSLGFAGRPADGLEDDALFQADAFTRVVDGDDVYYDSPISFNTVPTNLELANRTQIEATCDLQTSGPSTKARFGLTLYREIYRGGAAPAPGTDTWPTAAAANAAIAEAIAAANAAKSAYQIALDNGFVGTEEEWLESLVGPNGTISGSNGVALLTTSRDFTQSDDGKWLYYTGGSAITLTMPASGITPGFGCTVIQSGAGQITFAAAGGVTIGNSFAYTKTRAQYSPASIGMLTATLGFTSGEME